MTMYEVVVHCGQHVKGLEGGMGISLVAALGVGWVTAATASSSKRDEALLLSTAETLKFL